MEYIRIRNWDRWQSYRSDRGQPPWIKVHRALLRNIEWVSLSDSERGQLVSIWLLAADHEGTIPASPDAIQKLCFMTKPPNLNRFAELGFLESSPLQPDVNVASNGSQHDANMTAQISSETDKSRDRDRVDNRKPQRISKTIIPEGFALTDEMRQFATERALNPEEEWEAFRDHHKAHNSTFSDWVAAWRTWCRNAQKWGGKKGKGNQAEEEPPRRNLFFEGIEQIRAEEAEQKAKEEAKWQVKR